jgi:hypothetical protein
MTGWSERALSSTSRGHDWSLRLAALLVQRLVLWAIEGLRS